MTTYKPCSIHSPSGCFMDGWRRIIKKEKTSLCEQAPKAMPHSQPFGLFHGRLAPYKTAKINAPACTDPQKLDLKI